VSKTMSTEEFVTRAIVTLRDIQNAKAVGKVSKKTGKPIHPSKGIHVVYSGLNAAIRSYYGKDTDVKSTLADLETAEVIDIVPAKGGPRIFLKGEAGDATERDYTGEKTLAMILASATSQGSRPMPAPAAKSRAPR